LRLIFERYESEEEQVPLTFVLMGSFISIPFPGNGYSTTYKSHWDSLAHVLTSFPRLTSQSTFIFIPGPNDPWPSHPRCLPQRGIPQVFTNRVRRLVKRIHFPSNPCRITYFTQEFCLFRFPLTETLLRNRIHIPPAQPPTLDESTLTTRDVNPPTLSPLTPGGENCPGSVPSAPRSNQPRPNILVPGPHFASLPPPNDDRAMRPDRDGGTHSGIRGVQRTYVGGDT
jgi:DNA polymerase alpha/epsilon subunit B